MEQEKTLQFFREKVHQYELLYVELRNLKLQLLPHEEKLKGIKQDLIYLMKATGIKKVELTNVKGGHLTLTSSSKYKNLLKKELLTKIRVILGLNNDDQALAFYKKLYEEDVPINTRLDIKVHDPVEAEAKKKRKRNDMDEVPQTPSSHIGELQIN